MSPKKYFCLVVILLITSALIATEVVPRFTELFEQGINRKRPELSEADRTSLLAAAVKYSPELNENKRIAGFSGVQNSVNGYYGGFYFGPILKGAKRADYLKMTVWGNSELGWRFDHLTRHITVQTANHPTWLWLEEPVTELQALDIIQQLKGRVTDNVPLDNETLTSKEYDYLHRFERSFWYPADLILPGHVDPWYSAHFVITARSQIPGSYAPDYFAAAQFALVDDKLKFIRINRPDCSYLRMMRVQRPSCSTPESPKKK